MSKILGGNVGDEAWKQSILGIKDGGFGFRPSVVASSTTGHQGASSEFSRLVATERSAAAALEQMYEARVASAVKRLEMR